MENTLCMAAKRAKYLLVIIVILVSIIGLASFFHHDAQAKEINNFDTRKFNEVGFTFEELHLFCDIAFGHEKEYLRKWETDIRVQIKNISEQDRYSIAEVDSVIAILAPLIAPLKIERVYSDGNLIVYRNVKQIPETELGERRSNANGLARVGRRAVYSWSIESACIYDCDHSHPHTLMHEFEHALGLEHPSRTYSCYLTIGRSAVPQYFRSWYQWADYMSQPFYLSEQEKTVIKMLYSPEMKSGLRKDHFMRQMLLK